MPRTLPRARRTRTNASRPSFEVLEERQLLSDDVVTNVLDSGPGSLRQAILDANASKVASKIAFSIPGGGVQTIKLASALPSIEIPLTIDGASQPGYAGSPLVAIDGSNVKTSPGLSFAPLATGSTVHGLAIERFATQGIVGVYSTLTIDSNEIGVDPTGNPGAGNGTGVFLSGLSSPTGELGAGSVVSNNVISGNRDGVELNGVKNALVTKNLIGTDASGRTDLGNSNDGVSINPFSTSVTVSNNTIANNGRLGIDDQGAGTIQSGNTLTNNGGLVANIVVSASRTMVTTTTGTIETVVYTLTNQGPHAASNVTFNAQANSFLTNFDTFSPTFPVLTQVGAETSPGGTISSTANINTFGSLEFAKFATLAPGASAGVAIQILISSSGTDGLLVSAHSDEPTTGLFTNIASTSFVASGHADLAVSALPPPVARVGTPETFTYVVTNRDPLYAVADAKFVLDFGMIPPLTATGVITSMGSVSRVTGNPKTDIYAGDLGVLAPGASAFVSATIVPMQPSQVGATISTYSSSDVDPNPVNNIAFAGTRATSSPTVVNVQLQPATGLISSVLVDFSTSLTKSQAQNLGNYRLTTNGGKTRIAIRSATYSETTHSVTLRLSNPLPRSGSPIKLVVGGPGTPGLTGIDGSKLLGGIDTATLNRS